MNMNFAAPMTGASFSKTMLKAVVWTRHDKRVVAFIVAVTLLLIYNGGVFS
jgi:hypothetical protein